MFRDRFELLKLFVRDLFSPIVCHVLNFNFVASYLHAWVVTEIWNKHTSGAGPARFSAAARTRLINLHDFIE